MLTWLKKFVLDILPSVAATIIGAYIVNHYIVPKSPSASQAAISSADSKSIDSSAAESKPGDGSADKVSLEKASFEKGVAEKTAIEKTAEKAAIDKAATERESAEARKHHPAPKLAAKPAADERRANDLARAAIERLAKGDSKPEPVKSDPKLAETPAKVADAPAKTTDAPRVQPVSTVAAVPAMQPLPPAINVTTPSPDAFEQGNAAPVIRQPYPQAAARSDDSGESRRVSPPAEIPGRRPLDLRAEAMSPTPADRTSLADDVVSTAKSMFHAVMPR